MLPLPPPGLAISTRELRRRGIDQHRQRALLDSGQLCYLRRGWYCSPGTPADVCAAGRVGGVLTCGPALRHHGVWVLTTTGPPHVRVPAQARALRSPADSRRHLDAQRPATDREAIVHWWGPPGQPSALLADLSSALADFTRCADGPTAELSVDSVLHRRPDIRPFLIAAGIAIGRADGVCESGTETRVWQHLRGRLPVARQVVIPGVGRVDFLIGDRLVIEVDSREHHERTPDYERDRQRDAHLSTLGYRVLRYTYRQVFEAWPEVEASIWAAVARGDHY